MVVLDVCLIAVGALLALLLYGCWRLGKALKHTADAKATYLAAAESYRQAEDRLSDQGGTWPSGRRGLRVVRDGQERRP